MKTLSFTNNDLMPALGLGTWKSEPGEVYNAVKTAIQQGYRHIDCAPIYLNEKEVGNALSESIAEGTVTRNELWITSKLWCNAHAKDDVIPALQQTLNDLQLDYLDLYLVHWPIALKRDVMLAQSGAEMESLKNVPLSETWQGMEATVKAGLAKHIGVSNYGIKNLEDTMAKATIIPEMNQIECHPYLQQNELINFCKEHGILVTAYSPLGSYDRPDMMKAANEPKLLDDPIIQKIAASYQASPAQVLISWALHKDISVIPKSVNPQRMLENLKAEKLALSDEDMKTIAGLDKDFRYVTGLFWVFEDGPYTLEDVWR